MENKKARRITVVDPVDPYGHKWLNQKILALLSNVAEVDYSVQSVPETSGKSAKGLRGFLKRVRAHYLAIKQVPSSDSLNLFLTFETVPMVLACCLTWRRPRLVLMCHNNLRAAQASHIHTLFLKALRFFDVKMVVLERFFTLFLVEHLSYPEYKCAVFPHPFPKMARASMESVETQPEKITICYLSGNVYQKGYDIFLKAMEYYFEHLPTRPEVHFDVLLKELPGDELSAVIQKLSEKKAVNIITQFLSRESYDELINNSTYMCLPFRSEFSYSCSAIFVEACGLGKGLIYSSIDLFASYDEEHGSIGYSFSEGDYVSLANLFCTVPRRKSSEQEAALLRLLSSRSDEVLANDLVAATDIS